MGRGSLGFIGLVLAAVGMAAPGCDADDDRDVPPRPDGGGLTPEPPRTLELEGASSFALPFGESETFEVRYLDAEGNALADHTVTFALDGEAHDSSLDSFEATTRDDGRVSGTLTAGSTPAAFRIRISAAHASSVHIDVSVSDVGFGDLSVTVLDEVDGRDVDRFVVRLHPDGDCEDPELDDGPVAREVAVPEDMTAVLHDLPADLTYGVVVHAEGAEGGVLGRGCVETHVEADEQVDVDVPVANVPLAVDGEYEARLQVEAESAAEMAASTVRAAGDALLDAVGGDANLLLDGVQAYLDAHPELDGETFAEMRNDIYEPDLALDLENAGVGAHLALEEVADVFEPALVTFEVVGPLSLDLDDGDEPVRWHVDEAAVEDPDTGDVHDIPLGGMRADVELTVHLDRDAVDLSTLEVPVSLGALSQGTLQALVMGDSDETLVDRLHDPLGCGVLMNFAVDGPLVGICDEVCVEVACTEAALVLLSALLDGTAELDATRSLMVFDTPVTDGTLADEVGDGAVDLLVLADLSGTWTTEAGGGGDAVAADFEATRTDDPSD